MKPCLDCGSLTSRTSRCAPCSRKQERQRGTATQRGYDAAWRRLAARAIKRQPWCTDCGTEGSTDNPLTGDHKVWPARSLADVAVRCRACNSRKGPAPRSVPTPHRGTPPNRLAAGTRLQRESQLHTSPETP